MKKRRLGNRKRNGWCKRSQGQGVRARGGGKRKTNPVLQRANDGKNLSPKKGNKVKNGLWNENGQGVAVMGWGQSGSKTLNQIQKARKYGRVTRKNRQVLGRSGGGHGGGGGKKEIEGTNKSGKGIWLNGQRVR